MKYLSLFKFFKRTFFIAPAIFLLLSANHSATAQAPGNDDLCGAVTLTPGSTCTTTSGSTAQATQTINSTSCNVSGTQRDVWYKFVATASSHSLTVTGTSTFDPVVQVFTAASCSTNASVLSGACTDASGAGGTENLSLSGLTVGSTYYVRVFHATSTIPASTSFTICLLLPPANDELCGAVTLTPGAAGVTTCTSPTVGDVLRASQTINSTTCNSSGTQRDVWYKFVAAATSHTVTVTGNGTFDAVVQAFTSSTCSTAATPISGACADVTGTGGTETLQINNLTVSNTYYVRVFHTSSTVPTNTTFSICVLTAPGNDELCGAVTLTTSSTCTPTSGNTALASQTINSTSCNIISAQRDVWYKFVATASSHTLSVVGNGTFDPVVQAFTASSCSSLPSSISSACTDATGAGGTEALQLINLTVGTTYYVRVFHATSTIPSNTSFTICLLSPPANDEPCGAVTLTPGAPGVTACANATNGDVSRASQTINSTACNVTSTQRDVWYKFVATATSHTITVTGVGTFDPVVQAFTATNCSTSVNPIASACADATGTGGTESIQLSSLTVGNSYYIRVFHYVSTTPSNTTFSICVLTAPSNDEPCGAVTLTAASSCTPTIGNVALASQTVNSTSCSIITTQRDVWYKFVATASSHTVTITGSASLDAVGQAFTATNCSTSLSPVAGSCKDASGAGGIETISLTGLNIGTTYYLRVHHATSSVPSTTSFTICVVSPASVANDDCSGSTNLTVGSDCTAPVSGTTISATNSGVSSSCGTTSDDVWYSFTAPANGSVHLEVTGTSGFDPALDLRNTSTCPSTGAGLLCYNYAATNAAEIMNVTGLTGNASYRVRVFRGGANSGTFNICASSGYVPSGNDNVANALAASVGTTSGNNNSNYGIQIGEPKGNNWLTADANCSQWFSFTPSSGGCYTIAATGFNTQIAVYTASNISNFGTFVQIGSDDNSGPNQTALLNNLSLTGGTTYYVQVNGYPYTFGAPTLNISVVNTSAPVAIAATNTGCNSFTANWNSVPGATGYRIDVSTDNFSTYVPGYQDANAGNVTSLGISNLQAGASYQYRIRAVGPCGTSTSSGTINVSTISSVLPTISLSASPNDTVCSGTAITFNANISFGGNNPQYQWKKNNQVVGGNSNSYLDNSPLSGDIITCTLNSNETCAVPSSVSSSPVSITVFPVPAKPVAGANTPLCAGKDIQLTCNAVNGAAYSWQGPNAYVASIQNPVITDADSSDAGKYLIRVTVNGCSSAADTVDVVVNKVPQAPIIYQNGNTLTAAPFSGTIQWYLYDVAVAGATDDTLYPATDGVYTVKVTDANGCQTTSASFNYLGTEVTSAPLTESFKVYPNPTAGLLRISSSYSGELLDVMIFNSVGQLVNHRQLADNRALNISELPEGLYFLQINDSKRMKLLLIR